MKNKNITYLIVGMVLLGTIATLSVPLAAAQGDVEIGTDTAIKPNYKPKHRLHTDFVPVHA